MLSDNVYLWLVISSCIALAVAGTLAVIELLQLQDQTMASGGTLFGG